MNLSSACDGSFGIFTRDCNLESRSSSATTDLTTELFRLPEKSASIKIIESTTT